METWLKGLDLKVKVIEPGVKVKYHCAAALASNYVIALLALSQSLLTECGFSPAEAEGALKPLFAGNAHHIVTDGMVQALLWLNVIQGSFSGKFMPLLLAQC